MRSFFYVDCIICLDNFRRMRVSPFLKNTILKSFKVFSKTNKIIIIKHNCNVVQKIPFVFQL